MDTFPWNEPDAGDDLCQNSKMWAEHFLYSLLDGDEMGICTLLARDAFVSSHGEPIPLPVLLVHLRHFWARYTSIYDVQVQALTSTVEGETARVEAAFAWTGLPYRAVEPVRVVGRARLALKLAEDGFWDVTQAAVPGVLESIAPGVVSFSQQEQ